jgi:hypothetical protein
MWDMQIGLGKNEYSGFCLSGHVSEVAGFQYEIPITTVTHRSITIRKTIIYV